MGGNAVELLPSEAAHAAIVVSLDLESRWSERKGRKFRDRPGRQERDQYAFSLCVQASEASRSGEKNVRCRGELRFPQDNFTLGKVGDLECGGKVKFVGIGEPGKCFKTAEEFQVRRTSFVFIVQAYIYGLKTTPIRLMRETNGSVTNQNRFPSRVLRKCSSIGSTNGLGSV